MTDQQDKISEEEIVNEAIAQGALTPEEGEQILEEDAALVTGDANGEVGFNSTPPPETGDAPVDDHAPTEAEAETDVKKPRLDGHRRKDWKPTHEQPGTNNITSEVIESESTEENE